MEPKLHNHGRKLLFSELFKGGGEVRLPCKVTTTTTVSDAENLLCIRAGSFSSEDIWSSGGSYTTPCNSVLGSELSSITSTTDSRDDDDEGDTDLIAELNRKMADYVLQDEDDDEDNQILLPNHEPERILEKDKGFGDCENDKLTDWRNEEEEEGNESQRRRTLLQQRILKNGSGMTRGSGPYNASVGTGVFFPRGLITPRPFDHRRKKSGCSTVLIPARVLQVLQQHHIANSNIIPEIIRNNGLMTRYPFLTGIGNSMPRSNEVTLQQKQQQQQHGEQHLEVSDLPKEWIY